MFAPVIYPDRIEPLVRTIEDTPPERIVATACDELRAGRSTDDLMLASVLAVIRSSDLPPVHHGGPVHPVAGLHAIRHMADRLPDSHARLAVIQHVVVSNRHVHFSNGGPFILPDADPVSVNDSVRETLEALARPVRNGEYHTCEHYFLYLLEQLPPMQVLEHLLHIATAKNALDDHYLLYPVYTWRVMHQLGAQYAKYLARPAVRFVTRPPVPPSRERVDAMIEDEGLLRRELRIETGEDETRAIAALGMAIGSCDDDFNEITHMVAEALVNGVSLRGVGEALSLGASHLFLRSRTRDWMEMHLNTTANTQRFVLRQPEISLPTKLRALLAWDSGPDVRMARRQLAPGLHPDPTHVAALGFRSQESLLQDIEALIVSLPARDRHDDPYRIQPGGDDVDRLTTMAQQYGECGHDPAALLAMLGMLTCQDEHSELHAYKHHQATYEEFYDTRASLRWVHMVAAVQGAAIVRNGNQTVFRDAAWRLDGCRSRDPHR